MVEVKLARKLVNLTDETISLYDEASGEIEDFEPKNDGLVIADGREDTYYVVEYDIDLAKAKRNLGQNLAVIADRGIGRGGKPVVSLKHAEDDDIRINLRQGNYDKFAYA